MTEISRRTLLARTTALTALCALPACHKSAPTPQASGDAAAEAMLAAIAERLVSEYPENATYYGIDKGRHAAWRGELTDRSAAANQRRRQWAGETFGRLQGVDRQQLSPAQALDVDVAEEAFRLAVAGWRFPYGDMAVLSGGNSFRNSPFPVTQLSGAFVDIPDFLDSKHPVDDAADADAYLSRVEAYAGELAAEAERIDAERARGVIPPINVLDIVLGQQRAAAALPADKAGVVETLRRKAAAAHLPDRYAADAEKLYAAKVAPALNRQIAALAAAHQVAWVEPGVWKQPQGDAWYAWALHAGTTTTHSADEMHRTGREQIAQILGQMDTLLKAQGMTQGSVGERMDALGKRPDLLFANDDAGRAKLLAYLNGRIADMRTRLPRAFATLVKGKLIIKRVPPAIQNGAPSGYAGPGSIDGSTPGIYYINLRDTSIWPRYSLPTLCYHEGIPGHIWQGEYANKLPLIRTHLAFNAYSEGWALYSEQLGDELGCYLDDPLGKLGYLQSIGFRACRLVVDTGLHAKRWTFAQALDWFRANTGMTALELTGELNRYCAMPGQACGYKMGHNEINAQRDRAKTALGNRYDIRHFDDAMVVSGNVPLTLLGRLTDRYIAGARA